MTFDTFFTDDVYAAMCDAAKAISDCPPGKVLILYGAAGVGKSHLLHAIRHRAAQEHPDRTVLLTTARELIEEFVECICEESTAIFDKRLDIADLLLVDDVQELMRLPHTLDWVLTAFDANVRGGQSLVLCVNGHTVGNLPARFIYSPLVFHVPFPSLSVKRAVILRETAARDRVIDEASCELIAENTDTIPEILGILNCIDLMCAVSGTPPTPRIVSTVLAHRSAR